MTAELFSTDPSKNDKPPPNGAPQGGLPLKRVSATIRVCMAGVADCWDALKSLGTLGKQAANAVEITGGTLSNVTLDNTCKVDAKATDTEKFAGLAVQQIYDLIYPIGEGRMFFNAASPPVWPNVKATWQLIDHGRYLRTADPLDAGSTGGDVAVSTSVSGGHNHGGVTGNATVVLDWPLGSDASGNSMPTGTAQTLAPRPHAHSIASVPDHSHSVQLTPVFVDVAVYRRVS